MTKHMKQNTDEKGGGGGGLAQGFLAPCWNFVFSNFYIFLKLCVT